MNFKKLFIFFYLSIFPLYISAQNNVNGKYNFTDNFDFSYSKNSKNSEDKNCISSYFLHEIAKHIPNTFSSPKYTFSYKIHTEIYKTSKKKYYININFYDKKCSGNVFYKSFDISEILTHTYADFLIKISSDDEKFHLEKQINNFNTDSILNFSFIDSVSDNNYNIEFINKKFFYNKTSKEIFNKKIKIINRYYFSIDLIKSAYANLLKINLDDHNNYPFVFIKIDETQRLLNFIKKNNYEEKLNLKNNDPENFLQKFNNLNILNNQLKTNFKNSINSLKFIFFKKDLKDLAKAYISSVEKQQKVLNSDYKENFVLEFYNNEYFLSFEKNFNLIFSKFYNSNNNLLSEFEKNIYELFLQNIDNQINDNNYIGASNNLIFIKEFCNNTNEKYNLDKIESNISRTKYGMFLSYLNIANKALELDNLDMAEKYINYAKYYQKNNSEYIISDAYIKKYYSLLANKYIDNANEEINIKNYIKTGQLLDKAIDISKNTDIDKKCFLKIKALTIKYKNDIYNIILDSAEIFISNNNLLKAGKLIYKAIDYQNKNQEEINSERAALLLSKIKYSNYISMIDEAEKLCNFERYDSAFNLLLKAQDFEKKYILLNINKRIDTLLKKTAEKIIIKNLKYGNIKAWGNELAEADSILNYALKMQKKYQLSDNIKINNALNYLKSKIQLKRCQNIDDEYFYNCLKAKEFIKSNNFINAEKHLNAAILCVKNDTVCNVIDDYASKALSKYAFVIHYQKSLIILKNNILDKKFDVFLSNYNDLKKFYIDNNISKYNIDFHSVNNYVLHYKNNEFTNFCLNNFINKKEYDNALNLLKAICKAKWQSSDYKYFQKTLSKLMANRDFKLNRKSDSKFFIKKYSNNNEWFSDFNRQYKISMLEKKINYFFKIIFSKKKS